MTSGAHTPEELETLLEDAFIIRDTMALSLLFEEGAVLDAGRGFREARGREEIAQVASAVWDRDHTYFAERRRVLQARDTALSLGRGINVLRRGPDGAWRYSIALMDLDQPTTRRER